jgi:hypothetical protein
MNIKEKYLKYKKKYLSLKTQYSGSDTTNVKTINFGDDIDNLEYNFPIDNFSFFSFGITDQRVLKHVPVSIKNISGEPIKTFSADRRVITYIFNTNIRFVFKFVDQLTPEEITKYQNDYNININSETYVIEFSFKDITRVVLTNNYTVYLLKKLILTRNNQTSRQIFTFVSDNRLLRMKGNYSINSSRILNLEIDTINDINLNDNLNNLFIFETIITIIIRNFNEYETIFEPQNNVPFDFEDFYDSHIKPEDICTSSNILAKNFTSSIINLLYIKFDFIKILHSEYTKILEKLFIEIIMKYKNNISSKCTDDHDRKFLLTNVLKKINTKFQNNILISVYNNRTNSESFISIDDLNTTYERQQNTQNIQTAPKQLEVVLDTGNSNTTIIGHDFARLLGYTPRRSINNFASGVISDQSIVYKNTIKFKIKFFGSNIDIGKEYKIEAYIGESFTTNMLLLGNNDDSLTDIFRSSYCISYEYNTSKYEGNKIAAEQNIHLLEVSIDNFMSFYSSNIYKDLTNKHQTILQDILNKLRNFYEQIIKYNNYVKKYFKHTYRERFDVIYTKLLTIKPLIETIEPYKIQRTTREDIKVLINFIFKYLNDIKIKLIHILED